MTEHANEIISLLWWMVIAIGGALVTLLGWVGKNINEKVEAIPIEVAKKVDGVHSELLAKVESIRTEQHGMAKDLRAELTSLDRRVLKIEMRCEANHLRYQDDGK